MSQDSSGHSVPFLWLLPQSKRQGFVFPLPAMGARPAFSGARAEENRRWGRGGHGGTSRVMERAFDFTEAGFTRKTFMDGSPNAMPFLAQWLGIRLCSDALSKANQE